MMPFEFGTLVGKSVLITGGCGFIGSNLARRLVKQGVEVSIFMRVGSETKNFKDITEKIEFIEGDLGNREDFRKAVEGKDYVFHFAWQTDLKKSMENPKEDIETDLGGLINILEVLRFLDQKTKVIFASSSTVVGLTDRNPCNENMREDPLSIYECNKLMAEKILRIYYETHGIKSTTLRISNVFGEYQRIDNPNRGVLNYMIGKALKGEDLTIYGDGLFVRDYCYIQNYIDAFILAAISEKTEGRFFVLGSGVGISFKDVVLKVKEIVKKVSGKNVGLSYMPFPEGTNKINQRDFIADTKRFNEATGWIPKIDFEEGLEKTIRFYFEKRI